MLLIVYRIGYHAVYLGEVPFALGTISDGAVYERAARDIAENFPLGTRPFYLQGLYAYLLAIPLLIKPWISLGLLLQIASSGCALWLFHRAMKRAWGAHVGSLSTLCLMAYPALMFYENKYLTASTGATANILMVCSIVWAAGGSPRRFGLVGAATGLAFLARPNLMLALPFAAYACVVARGREPGRWAKAIVPFALGFGLSVAPMALRNQLVTGHPDTMPVHGGGTSFYIGNNPHAHGVWNDAGGMISARVEHEPAELHRELGLERGTERAEARAIGDELYRRGLIWIRDNPGDWVRLEARKLWITVGSQELAQDYDWHGEQELLPYAHRLVLPFGALLALGFVGFRAREQAVTIGQDSLSADGHRALAWLLLGQLVAVGGATLIYFTSSQHRLPLCIPLAVYAGPGAWVLFRWVRSRRGKRPASHLSLATLIVAAGLLAQSLWPRTKLDTPHPVHYYNLAVVLDENGEPLAALPMVERAIELEPDEVFFRLKRATLLRRLGDLDRARADLDWILARRDLPYAVRDVAQREMWTVAHALRLGEEREEEALPAPP